MKQIIINSLNDINIQLKNFDIILSSDDKCIFSINIFNPSCLSHGALFYDNQIYEFTRKTKQLEKNIPNNFFKNKTLILIIEYKDQIFLQKNGINIFNIYYNKIKNYKYGFLKKNETYCFEWIMNFFQLINSNLIKKIKNSFFNSYYIAETFMDLNFFDLKFIIINNQQMITF